MNKQPFLMMIHVITIFLHKCSNSLDLSNMKVLSLSLSHLLTVLGFFTAWKIALSTAFKVATLIMRIVFIPGNNIIDKWIHFSPEKLLNFCFIRIMPWWYWNQNMPELIVQGNCLQGRISFGGDVVCLCPAQGSCKINRRKGERTSNVVVTKQWKAAAFWFHDFCYARYYGNNIWESNSKRPRIRFH